MHGNVDAVGNWRWALGSDDFSDIYMIYKGKTENINKTRVLLMLLMLLMTWNPEKCLKRGFC